MDYKAGNILCHSGMMEALFFIFINDPGNIGHQLFYKGWDRDSVATFLAGFKNEHLAQTGAQQPKVGLRGRWLLPPLVIWTDFGTLFKHPRNHWFRLDEKRSYEVGAKKAIGEFWNLRHFFLPNCLRLMKNCPELFHLKNELQHSKAFRTGPLQSRPPNNTKTTRLPKNTVT